MTIEIAIEGHDGAGKTTLALALAEVIDGTYLRPFGDIGQDLSAKRDLGQIDTVNYMALNAVKVHRDGAVEDRPVIFDRHWMSIVTMTRTTKYLDLWNPLPLTILCTVDVEETMIRLAHRGEVPGNAERHSYYHGAFLRLASMFGIQIIDTSILSPAECLETAMDFIATQCGKQVSDFVSSRPTSTPTMTKAVGGSESGATC